MKDKPRFCTFLASAILQSSDGYRLFKDTHNMYFCTGNCYKDLNNKQEVLMSH